MREQVFLVGAGRAFKSTFRIEPPLMITSDEINYALTTPNEVFEKIK